jgi:glycosyltransferase involved in cell wall biosynthesis
MHVVFVGHRCCDHSPSSGYDQVCALVPEAGWLDGRALEAGRLEWIREPGDGRLAGSEVFHVFYGDCSGKHLPALIRAKFADASIVSSVHQPVVRLRADEAAWAAVEASDRLITVSAVQADELRQLGIRQPIHAIPHGVWTKVFRAETSPPAGNFVLIVGSYLRDWAAARYVINALSTAGVRSVALGAGAREHLSTPDVMVEGLARVSEDELVRLYQSAAAVFLPFLEATASNALLEAMAAGCPVVCPHRPSLVHEYLGDDVDTFPAGSLDVAVARLQHYVGNPAARDARSRTLAQRAERFDWNVLAPRYDAVYADAAARVQA